MTLLCAVSCFYTVCLANLTPVVCGTLSSRSWEATAKKPLYQVALFAAPPSMSPQQCASCGTCETDPTSRFCMLYGICGFPSVHEMGWTEKTCRLLPATETII